MADRIDSMIGMTMRGVSPASKGSEELVFTAEDGTTFRFYHGQDCCENVAIEDICGDLADLIGSPITQAEEVVSEPDAEPKPGEYAESWTWTFYKFATVKGGVTVRWLGESNGYYSESVDLEVSAPQSVQ